MASPASSLRSNIFKFNFSCLQNPYYIPWPISSSLSYYMLVRWSTQTISAEHQCAYCVFFCKRSSHQTTDEKQDKKGKFAWSTIMKKMTKLECEVLNLLYSININKPHSTGWGLFSNSAISKFYDVIKQERSNIDENSLKQKIPKYLCLWFYFYFYWTRVRSLGMLVTNSLTD